MYTCSSISISTSIPRSISISIHPTSTDICKHQVLMSSSEFDTDKERGNGSSVT